MGKGSSGLGGNGGGNKAQSRTLTDDEMNVAMQREFQAIDAVLDEFLNHNPRERNLDEMGEEQGLELPYIEKHTVKDLVETYIDDFNQNVKEYGNGFEFYDPDQSISILYKDGHTAQVNIDFWDGSKRIPKSNIDSIIVDSGWGTAVAGKNIRLYNYREEVDYGRYGYRSVKARYDDFNDIRADFK